MEPSPSPTAADLGITEVEYERILRGLQQREQPATLAEHPVGRPPARRARWWVGTALVLLLTATALGLGGSEPAPEHSFLSTAYDGSPVRYSSCRPIRVEIYPAGGPPDAESLVREAVARVRTATGLDLVVSGVFGGHAPNWNFRSGATLADDPVSVSWQDGAALAEMTDDTAGLGGSPSLPTASGGRRLTSGTIALSRDYFAEAAAEGDRAHALAVVLHEFGHVLGLGHVDSDRELMHHDNVGRTAFGPGDLEGLRIAGQGPCV